MNLSLPLISLITFALILGSIYLGYGLHQLFKRFRPDSVIDPSGTAVGALMGLLAFMLAFAFGMGANKLNERKAALLQEINAISTLYLRTDLLPEEASTEYKSLIREYVRLRVDLQQDPTLLGKVIARSDEITGQFWSKTIAGAQSIDSEMATAFIESTNAVIDAYEERVFHGLQHIPIVIWMALIGMSVLAMLAMGYQLGLSGKMSHIVNVLVALTFSVALVMIADFDKYDDGFFQIPFEPMERLHTSISEDI